MSNVMAKDSKSTTTCSRILNNLMKTKSDAKQEILASELRPLHNKKVRQMYTKNEVRKSVKKIQESSILGVRLQCNEVTKNKSKKGHEGINRGNR